MAKAKKEESGNEALELAQKAMELAEANKKAIDELREQCKKGITTMDYNLSLLKERNRLR